jgi:hypothetical protein
MNKDNLKIVRLRGGSSCVCTMYRFCVYDQFCRTSPYDRIMIQRYDIDDIKRCVEIRGLRMNEGYKNLHKIYLILILELSTTVTDSMYIFVLLL